MKKFRYFFPRRKHQWGSHSSAPRYVKLDVKKNTLTTVLLNNTSRVSFWDKTYLDIAVQQEQIREIKRKPHPLKLK